MKRTLSAILAILLMLPTLFGINALAASYPSISSSKYIEFKAQQNINVYQDTACKTRGTCSPSKKYDASIAKNDVCYIYEIKASYIKVNYPTSSGRRTGYIKRSDLFDKTAPEEYIQSAEASVTVYKAEGNSSIAKGDEVWRVDPKNGYTGYRAVIYEAKSGNRAYKMGYITLNDLDKIKNGSKDTKSAENDITYSPGSKESAVKARLDAIANGTVKLDKNTTLTVGEKFTGTNAGEQCKGYARNLFNLCFGINVASTQPKPSNYLLYAKDGVTKVGSVTGMSKGSASSEQKIEALFSKAKPGDFVQMRRQNGGSHSAIVYFVSNSGVTFLEANTDGKNTVKQLTHTWASLCEKNAAMSVYTATNYKLK